MSYFSIYALDRPGMSEKRQALRPSHRERLRLHDHPVKVHVGGPMLDEQGAMIGTLLIIEAGNREQVQSYLAGDPYVAADLFQTLDIRPFAWGLGVPERVNG